LTDNRHTFEFILNGNCRRPYYHDKQPGDFVTTPKRVEDVPLADNLKVEKRGGGLEARWLIENADGKDVAFRAFFAAPAPEKIQATTGDGWLAYVRPVARNKYLSAKVEGTRNARFLTVLYPDLVNDARDDVKMERVGDGAKLMFPNGNVHVIRIKSEEQAEKGEKETSDADIVFYEKSPAGKVEACFLTRGSSLDLGEKTVITSAKVNTLSLDFRKSGEVRGYLSAAEEVTLNLRIGASCGEAAFNGRLMKVTHKAE